MTAAVLGPSVYCCCSKLRPATLSSSTSTNPRCLLSGSVASLGFRFLSPWNGLKHLTISFPRNYTYLVKKVKPNRTAVYASLFGVGAPEALVIGVVALLIFGPKGLAEVARNLGKTLKSFQPTIRELQEVSREFKSSFEREIGLDELNSTINTSSFKSNSVVNESQQAVSDTNGRPVAEPRDLMKSTEEPSATTNSWADSPEEQPKDGRPVAEQQDLITSTEELSAPTKNQADSPELQPIESKTTEGATSNSIHSEEMASGLMDVKDQASPLQ